VLVDLIPKIYDTARQVRILNIDQTERFVPINQEYEDPETGEIKLHDLSAGRFDIYTEAGNTFATKREETKSLMLDVLGAAGQYAPAILPLLLKNIDMDGAEDALEAINQINQMQGLVPPKEGQQPMQNPNQPPMPPIGGMTPQGFPQ
jgi:hypothetical protein